MADLWWSKAKCPVCGTLMGAQRWGTPEFKITCDSCGYYFLSLRWDGVGGSQPPEEELK